MLKRMMPRSLFGRSLLILVTPVVVLQLVLAYVFYERHWDTVTRRLALGFAGDISMVIQSLREVPDEAAQTRVLSLARTHFAMDVDLRPGEMLDAAESSGAPGYSILDRMLTQALEERLFRPFVIDTQRADGRVEVRVQVQDGVLHVVTQRKRLDSTTTTIFVLWMVGTSLILLAVAILFLRNQMRPIRALARAADAFGKGHDLGPVKPAGATEIRQAARAFTLMRERMNAQMTQRTEMLAGVSHDLRTPLTRMKLQLEILGAETEVGDLKSDVRDMETMVEGYLDFARGQDAEPPVATDLRGVLESVIDDAKRQGRTISLDLSGDLRLPLRPNAIKRCLTNLVDNAIRYAVAAGGTITVNARRDPDSVEIVIDDPGPGIPVDKREEAFRPFSRLDVARNPETGGVGLGLTIARDIARGHGGDLTLEDGPLGGLRARIRLPV